MYEARDDDAKEMRRLAAAERRAGNSDRMDSKAAAKYAGSEAKSAEREDKKSKGKHIHGYAIGESAVPGKPAEKLGAVSSIPKDEQDAARERTLAKAAAMRAKKGITKEEVEVVDEGYMPPTQKRADKMMKQSSKLHSTGSERGDFGHPEAEKKHTQASKIAFMSRRMSDKAKERDNEARRKEFKEQLELELRAHLRERALDASETKEKESVYKAIKPSKLAKSYPEKSPKELKSLRYAISTNQAKKNMDTSRSDKRYGVEG
jgi:hypothetical protein